MKPIPVVALPPGDQWDQTLLDDLISGDLWPHGLEFERLDAYPMDTEGIVLVVPGRYYADRTAEISEAIARYSWVLGFRCGDEEDLLDTREIVHPNVRWWLQTPHVARDYNDARFLPLGYTPHFADLGAEPPEKSLDVFISAQASHKRRRECFVALAGTDRTAVIEQTAGFIQGMAPQEYVAHMTAAKVAPCPSGAVSPDSFRVFEALEAHCVPIVDDISPSYDSRGYWERMFPGAPLPVLADYKDLRGYIADALADFPRNANRIAAWWMAQKRTLAAQLREDLGALGVPLTDSRPPITVLVSTSPLPSHPSTRIIDETIASVRAQLPTAEIILMCDGVRPEQEARRADYETYLQRVLWSANHVWGNVLPLIFDEHLHQSGCTKRALEHVHTPLVLFVEGDTPLVGEIPWPEISDVILAGDANLVRFSHEASILEPHRHLALDSEPQKVRGVPMTRTVQWSQRPHLASTAFYRELLDRWFPNSEKNFIEETVYGRLISAYQRDGDMGWLGWRTWLYTPEGDIKRSTHTDGREGESNYV